MTNGGELNLPGSIDHVMLKNWENELRGIPSKITQLLNSAESIKELVPHD